MKKFYGLMGWEENKSSSAKELCLPTRGASIT